MAVLASLHYYPYKMNGRYGLLVCHTVHGSGITYLFNKATNTVADGFLRTTPLTATVTVPSRHW